MLLKLGGGSALGGGGAGSPPIRTSTLTPSVRANTGRTETGTPRRPTSHEVTVCCETPMMSASCTWVMEEPMRNSAIRAAIALKNAFSSGAFRSRRSQLDADLHDLRRCDDPRRRAPGVNITAPANITIAATTTDSDGTVTKVDFFDGATLLGTATAAPYSVTLSNAALGSHSFTARATDDLGAVTTSSAISVVVNAAPTVALTSPASGASFIAPANITLTATAADSDGTVQKVDFFQGGTSLIATATSAPYTVNWSSVAPGSYSVTAVATDNRNATTTSAPVSVTVVANALPAVSITSPASGANFTAPANIAISATALDSDGTIQKVEFFYGGTNLIATLTAPPYSFTWTAVPQGTYSLTAVATDNLNGTRTSAAANVTVGRAPALNFVHVDHLNTPRLVAGRYGYNGLALGPAGAVRKQRSR